MKKLLSLTLSAVMVLVLLGICTAQAEDFGYTRQTADGVHARLIVLASPLRTPDQTAIWEQPKYTANDILRMIEDLKPNVLERMITGKQDPNLLLPADPGEPEMTVAEFLTRAQAAGGPGCIIIPKINLKWSEKQMLEAAQNLYDLPIYPPIRTLNLDNWEGYFNDPWADEPRTPETLQALLQKFKDMGWKDIGFNSAGGYKETWGYVSFIDFLINRQEWTVRTGVLDNYKKDPDVRWQYLYIDYPGQMQAFSELPTDRQAELLTDVICELQHTHNYRFVYPLIQDFWHAEEVFTSADGPYKGASIYDIMKGLMERDRERGGVYDEAVFDGIPDKADDKPPEFPLKVFLDGNMIKFDVQPQIIEGRTMVPVRAIFEAMGAEVEWDEDTQTVTGTKTDEDCSCKTTVKMVIGKNVIHVNGVLRELDTAPRVIDGRTLAPARFVAEAFGGNVTWNEKFNTVGIKTWVLEEPIIPGAVRSTMAAEE